uniref:Nuclear transport factor 2 n=1 Tax=Tanacetum cinerariifolium TaxID=118510 RepID=A0A6L2P3P3_TANCI|nr:nuclear transport factor 2 [Tanacetum cinerariifolium]
MVKPGGLHMSFFFVSFMMLLVCNQYHVKENVALTYFDEEFVHEDPKELSYAQEKVKEDVSLGSGLEAVEKKLEKDGTYSSREQGEADWELASEIDLQDFHYTIFEQKWAGIQGLGSNYKRNGLEFYFVIFLVCNSNNMFCMDLSLKKRMIWDPGIRVFKILTLHLEDNVFLRAEVRFKTIKEYQEHDFPTSKILFVKLRNICDMRHSSRIKKLREVLINNILTYIGCRCVLGVSFVGIVSTLLGLGLLVLSELVPNGDGICENSLSSACSSSKGNMIVRVLPPLTLLRTTSDHWTLNWPNKSLLRGLHMSFFFVSFMMLLVCNQCRKIDFSEIQGINRLPCRKYCRDVADTGMWCCCHDDPKVKCTDGTNAKSDCEKNCAAAKLKCCWDGY